MEQNRFFKWLWRINAMGLFFLIGAGLYSFIKNELLRPSTYEIKEPITSVAKDPKGVEKWVLGYEKTVYGSDYSMVPLVSKYSKVKALNQVTYSQVNNIEIYNENLAKNILFVNRKDNSSSWLFSTNNQLIVDYYPFIDDVERVSSPQSTEKIKAKVVYYKIIDKDTNGDKIVTLEDKQNFALSDVSGKKYRVIVREVDRIVSMHSVDNKELHLVYQQNGVGYALKVDMETFKVMSDVLLPKVGE